MLSSSFNRRVGVLSLGLFALCTVFTVLLLGSGPRVRFVQFQDGFFDRNSTRERIITIRFDRSIEQRDYADSITLEPAVAFTTTTRAQSIELLLDEDLAQDTTYTITVSGVNDRSGRSMSGQHVTSFTTRRAAYMYLERNAQQEQTDNLGEFADMIDVLYRAEVGGDPEVVFEHPLIVSYAANSTHVVIVVRDLDGDSIIVLDQETGQRSVLQPLLNGQIGNLSIARSGPVAAYTVTPDFQSVDLAFYEVYANRLEVLRTDTLETSVPLDDQGQHLKVYATDVDRYGQAVLAQDNKQDFYIISPYDDFAPQLLGAYTSTLGFSNDGASIGFRSGEAFALYDIADGRANPVDVPEDVFVNSIDVRGNDRYVVSNSASSVRVESFLERYQNDVVDRELLWQVDDQTGLLESLDLSYGARLFSAQIIPKGCEFDTVALNTQCVDVETLIFDIDGQEIARHSGFDLVWLP